MEVEWAAAGIGRVKVDFPGLSHRIRLDEVALVMHMETLIGGKVFQIGRECCDVDNCHAVPLPSDDVALACHSRVTVTDESAPWRCEETSAPHTTVPRVRIDALQQLFDQVAHEVGVAAGGLEDWGLAGTRPGQYRVDLAADQVAIDLLVEAGVGVLSEESGLHHPEREVVVVVDPIDGSTNAAAGLPWFATSLCAVSDGEMVASLVINHATGTRYRAVRGGGATRDHTSVTPLLTETLSEAIVAMSGWSPQHLGWRQYRALGAAALDICAVADGTLDAFVDVDDDAHAPWDYLGAVLVCQEAGLPVADAFGRDLVVLEHDARRTPVAAVTTSLHTELLEARRSLR